MKSRERSGEILIFWGDNVLVHQVIKSEFCIEMEIEGDGFERGVGVIFIYASTDVNTKKAQWETLKEKIKTWGKRWVLGRGGTSMTSLHKKISKVETREGRALSNLSASLSV